MDDHEDQSEDTEDTPAPVGESARAVLTILAIINGAALLYYLPKMAYAWIHPGGYEPLMEKFFYTVIVVVLSIPMLVLVLTLLLGRRAD